MFLFIYLFIYLSFYFYLLFREFRKIQHKEYLKYKYEATEKILKKKY